MAAVNAVLAPSLYPSIFDPSSGDFLVGGTISWFGQDMVTPKNVWPTPDTTQSPYPNPYTLDSIAAEPPMYYLTDEPYWIEIRPAPPAGCDCMEVDPYYSFLFYPNTQVPSSQTQDVQNFITNGQFQNPINFNAPEEQSEKIYNNAVVAPGWTYQLTSSDDDVDVFFENVFDDSLPANPANLINITVNSGNAGSLYQKIGFVNTLQGENLTLSLQGNTQSGAIAVLNIVIQQYYGIFSQSMLVGQLTLPLDPPSGTVTLSLPFKMPSLINAGTDQINNACVLLIVGPNATQTTYRFGNVQLEKGTVASPAYIEQPRDLVTSLSIANAFQVPTNLFNQQNGFANYTKCTFINNQYTWTADTGTFKPVLASAVPPDMLVCDGQSLNPQAYVNGIPLQRLYDVIGNQFGGSTNIVATSQINVVTAGSAQGARELTAWTAGNSGFTVTKTQTGLQMGVSAALTSGSTTSVDMTFLDNFAPLQVYGAPSPYSSPNSVIGCEYNVSTPSGQFASLAVTSTTINTGSPSAQAVGRLAFVSNNISNYKTDIATGSGTGNGFAINFLEFASLSNNFRGNYTRAGTKTNSPMCVLFSVDGAINNTLPAGGSQAQILVPFLSTQSLAQNVQTFIRTVNNPFRYTVTVNALPAASQYFTFSSSGTNYYLWVTLNGSGTDPAPGGTGVLCALLSSDTTTTAAQKIATAMQSTTFGLPTQADLVAPGSGLIVWAIAL